jgi:UDP-N-acetylglucosamine--N-acetylmuramyl-(pentapeptide) pyrophosphoryl-undecaprenol N-acetylglucosamine transferase
MTRRIAMVVGDTAGHVMPALAVVEAYREIDPALEVVFLSAAGCAATRIVPEAGHRLVTVPASAMARAGPHGVVASVARLGPGLWRATEVLSSWKTRLVIGTGGYPSGPVLPAARGLGLTTAVLEANAAPGMANRWLGHLVHRVWLGFPQAAPWFPASRRRVTGTPVRGAWVRRLVGVERVPPRGRPTRVLVTGGARGAAFLGARGPGLVGRMRARGLDVEVVHHVGPRDEAAVRGAWDAVGVAATVTAHIANVAEALLWADVAVARPGASTLAELALAGLPALLVPLADAARDHQADNADAYRAGGAALCAREGDWDADALATALVGLLTDPRAWQAMSDAAHAQATPDAAQRIVEDCETLMRGRW